MSYKIFGSDTNIKDSRNWTQTSYLNETTKCKKQVLSDDHMMASGNYLLAYSFF